MKILVKLRLCASLPWPSRHYNIFQIFLSHRLIAKLRIILIKTINLSKHNIIFEKEAGKHKETRCTHVDKYI